MSQVPKQINQYDETTTFPAGAWMIMDLGNGIYNKISKNNLRNEIGTPGGGGDTQAPTITGMVVQNANPSQLLVTFDEPVTGLTPSLFSALRAGSTWVISSITGSGASYVFNMATPAANGEQLRLSYSGTAVRDLANNALAAFTNAVVTNNIGSTQLGTPTGGAATAVSSSQINCVGNTVPNATVYVLEGSLSAVGGFSQIYSGGSPSYNHTGLNPSTQWFYRWKVQAPGFADSNYGSVFNATTQAAAGNEWHSTFTDTDGTPVASHTPEAGSAMANYLGTMQIQGNKLVPGSTIDAGGGFMVSAAIFAITKQDFTLQITYNKNPAKQMIFGLRRTSDGVRFMGGNIFLGQIQLAQQLVVGGFPANQVTWSGVTAVNNTNEHLFELVVSGTTVSLKVDGTTLSPTYNCDPSVNGLQIYVGFQDLDGGAINELKVI